jgi:hypothetical protein
VELAIGTQCIPDQCPEEAAQCSIELEVGGAGLVKLFDMIILCGVLEPIINSHGDDVSQLSKRLLDLFFGFWLFFRRVAWVVVFRLMGMRRLAAH